MISTTDIGLASGTSVEETTALVAGALSQCLGINIPREHRFANGIIASDYAIERCARQMLPENVNFLARGIVENIESFWIEGVQNPNGRNSMWRHINRTSKDWGDETTGMKFDAEKWGSDLPAYMRQYRADEKRLLARVNSIVALNDSRSQEMLRLLGVGSQIQQYYYNKYVLKSGILNSLHP